MAVWWGWCSMAQTQALGTSAGASLKSHLPALANATDTTTRHTPPLGQKQALKRMTGGGGNQNAKMERLWNTWAFSQKVREALYLRET